MTAADCLEILKDALERFGTRAYYDKGPEGVMDLAAIDAVLERLPPLEVARTLNDLYEQPHGHLLARTLLVGQSLRADFKEIEAACLEELVEEEPTVQWRQTFGLST